MEQLPHNSTIAGDGCSFTPKHRPPMPTSAAQTRWMNISTSSTSSSRPLAASIFSTSNVASQQLPLSRHLHRAHNDEEAGRWLQHPGLVVNMLDDGKNLETFTMDLLNSCIANNQSIKGKT